jgi:translocation and assembly module TamB
MLSLSRVAKSVFLNLLLVFVLFTAIAVFFITTTPGLYCIFQLAGYFLPGQLKVEQLHGRLLNHFGFSKLQYDDGNISIDLKQGSISWQSKALLHHQLIFDSIKMQQLKITTLSPKTDETETTPFALPKLPLDILLKQVWIGETQFTPASFIQNLHNLNFQAHLSNSQWDVRQLNLNLNAINIQGDIKGEPLFPYRLSANFRLASFAKNQPKLKANLNIGGDILLYTWRGKLTSPGSLELSGTLKRGKEIQSEAHWQHLAWILPKQGSLQSSEGQLHIEGNVDKLNIRLNAKTTSPLVLTCQLQATTSPQGMNAEGNLSLSEGKLNFHINYNKSAHPHWRGSLKGNGIALGKTLKDLNLTSQFSGNTLADLNWISQATAQYLDHALKANFNYDKQKFKSHVNLGNNEITISGNLHYPWQLEAKLAQPQLLALGLSPLNTNIKISAFLKNAQEGRMNLSIAPGHLDLSEGGELSKLAFKGGEVNAELTPDNLSASGLLTIDSNKRLDLVVKLPHFSLQKGLPPNQPVQANLRLVVNSLDFLKNFSSDISHAQGQLQAFLKAEGTLDKPNIEGSISLKGGKITLANWGLDLNSAEFDLKSRSKRWQASGHIQSNKNTLVLQGQGEFLPKITGILHINGDNFVLINTAEYLINISPKLVIELLPTLVAVKGEIIVPKAQIKLQSFTNSVSLSEDVVFAGEQKTTHPLPLKTDVRLIMGEDVAVNVKGLKGLLTGSIQLNQAPNQPLAAHGELTIQRGKYLAYGQELTIEQGELFFTGPAITNPGVRVVATRKFNKNTANFPGKTHLLDFNPSNLETLNLNNNVKVGIKVTGRVNSPKMELFSSQGTIPQADILSMLLLGKTVDHADKAGGQLLLAAISSMNLNSGTNGTQLMDQLKQALGVDLNLESTPKYDQKTNQLRDKNSVVLGKSLSKRLYLSYNFGLGGGDSDVVTLTYLLNKFFSLQVNSSLSGSGIDLLYTHRKD